MYAEHAFHGLTTGALALNGGQEFKEGFGPLLPDCAVVPFGDLDGLESELRAGDVAAFVVEPIQGKGVYCAEGSYWSGVQELCRRHRTLFVIDEVQTGLGRTGKFFCHEHFGLEPDIITVSKALSGGYVPVGAMLTTDRVFQSVYQSMEDALEHSTTFGRNQLAMVAGLATLAAFDDEDIVANAERTGRALTDGLRALQDRHDLIHDVRGLGLMIGIEFGEPESRSARRRFRTLERLRPAMFSQMVVVPLFHRHGILTQVAADNVNIVKLLPPLVAGAGGGGLLRRRPRRRAVRRRRGSRPDLRVRLDHGQGCLRPQVEAPPQGAPAGRGGPGRSRGSGGQRVDAGRPGRREGRHGGGRRYRDPAVTAAVVVGPGDRVVVTGASGFIGSAVVRALLARGAEVVAASEPGADERNLAGLDVECALVDVRHPEAVRAVCKGARFVFHLAAIYRFWAT